VKDLIIEKIRLAESLTAPWPQAKPIPAIRKIFVDDWKGNTIAEFNTEKSALNFMKDYGVGLRWAIRIFKPTEEEFEQQCAVARAEWRWAHGVGA
jgi:hypothetical protein